MASTSTNRGSSRSTARNDGTRGSARGRAGASTSRTKSRTSGRAQDAIALLKEDHREVEKLAARFEKASSSRDKQAIATKICQALKVHTQIEEEIFYPAVREEIRNEDLLDEAQVEHASAKDLISQIEGMQPDDQLFDATVTVLVEYVKHHVKEEEKEMFPQTRKLDLDLKALGEQIRVRKQELMQQVS